MPGPTDGEPLQKPPLDQGVLALQTQLAEILFENLQEYYVVGYGAPAEEVRRAIDSVLGQLLEDLSDTQRILFLRDAKAHNGNPPYLKGYLRTAIYQQFIDLRIGAETIQDMRQPVRNFVAAMLRSIGEQFPII